ncbi:MAG: histidinol-phosphate transaminase [Oscillochloris sp.]|nr:histidinol-phosphate transaminase [Oscillochloris sp.]
MHYKEHIQSLPAYKPAKLVSGPSAELVKLSSNENPLGPSPKAIAAFQAIAGEIHRYPDAGALALRSALGAKVGLGPEHVICSNGSDELLLLICLGLLGEGDEALMASGTFISYLIRSRELGARAVQVPLRNHSHDLPAMAAALRERTRVVFVCNPNNPTGATVGAAEVQAFLAAVPDDVLIVMDEAYVEFATRTDYPDLLPELRAGRKNVILLRTFAKIHGLAGLRLGYGYAHPELIGYLDRVRPVFNVSLPAQVAGIAALDDDEHLERSRAHAIASRAFFEHRLRGLGLKPIAGETNFVAFAVGDDAAVTAGLRERGFAVTPLAGWGLPGLIRVSFGTEEQNERFIAALQSTLEA